MYPVCIDTQRQVKSIKTYREGKATKSEYCSLRRRKVE